MPITRVQDFQIHSLKIEALQNEIAEARGDKTSLAERLATLASGSSADIAQVTKLNITATSESPYIVDIPIRETKDFKRLPVEVLKFVPGEKDKMVTLCEFDNADASSFHGTDPQVVFDGTMRLKTIYDIPMEDGGPLGDGRLWTLTIDKSQFKAIESLEVF